eukprot:NP_494183.1 Uncharacterized protein CELE_R52.4 [Caenorhabditis elegans]
MSYLSTFTFITLLIILSNGCMRTIPPDEAYISSTMSYEDTTPGSPGTSEATTPATVLPCQQCDVVSIVKTPAHGSRVVPTTWTETAPTAEGCLQYEAYFEAPTGNYCGILRVIGVFEGKDDDLLYDGRNEISKKLIFTCQNDVTWSMGSIIKILEIYWLRPIYLPFES